MAPGQRVTETPEKASRKSWESAVKAEYEIVDLMEKHSGTGLCSDLISDEPSESADWRRHLQLVLDGVRR
jgi:hypothetical protein